MKGTLYLGTIRDFKALNDKAIKCFSITLSKRFDNYMDNLRGLNPSSDLLNWHMNNKDRLNFNDGYYERYFNQVKNSKQAQEDIKTITTMLDRGDNVALICFCADPFSCHRGILGKWFERKGYNVSFK